MGYVWKLRGSEMTQVFKERKAKDHVNPYLVPAEYMVLKGRRLNGVKARHCQPQRGKFHGL